MLTVFVLALVIQIAARRAFDWPCETWWDYLRPRFRRKDGSVS